LSLAGAKDGYGRIDMLRRVEMTEALLGDVHASAIRVFGSIARQARAAPEAHSGAHASIQVGRTQGRDRGPA